MKNLLETGTAIALILIFALTGTVARAKVVQSVTAGFDNQARECSWAPVSFQCVNDTGKDLEGELEVFLPGRDPRIPFTSPVHLPSPSRKLITLGVYLDSIYYRTTQSLEWKLVSHGRVLESGVHKFEVGTLNDLLLLAVASNPTAFQLLQGRKTGIEEGSIVLVSLTLPDLAWLPDRAFYYSGLDGILWGDPPPGALRPEQMEALAGYVRAGGSLIAYGGPAGEQLKGTWLEDLLPVEIQGQRALSRLSVAESVFLTPLDLGAGWVATEARIAPEKGGFVETLLTQDEMPLLVRAPRGLGWTSWLAIDPNTPPFLAWPAASEFLDYLLFNARVRVDDSVHGFTNTNQPVRYRRIPSSYWSNTYQSLLNSLFNDPVIRPPSLQFVSLFLLIYVLIVGPVNYFILRRRKKLEWTWVTIPLIVLVFLGAEYGMGRYMKGGKAVVNEAVLLLGRAGDLVVQQQSLAGFFSPSKRRYQLEYAAEQGRILPPLNDSTSTLGSGASYRQEGKIVLADYPMNMWTMEAFSARGETTLDGLIQCEVEESGQDNVARVLNDSSLNLKNPCLLWKGNYYLLPETTEEPETPAFNLGKGSASIPGGFIGSVEEPGKGRRQALYDYLKETWLDREPGAPFLLAWVDSPLEGFKPGGIRGVFRQQALLCLQLDPPRQSTQLRIPFSHYRFRVLTENAKSWRESVDLEFNEGQAVVELLPNVQFSQPSRIDKFLLRMNLTNRSGHRVSLAAFDWYRNEWVPVVDSLGDKRSIGSQDNISLSGLPGVNSLVFLRPADRAVRLRFGVEAPESVGPSAMGTPDLSGAGAGTGMPGMGMMPGMMPSMNPSREDAVSISQIGIRLEGQIR